MGVNVKIKRLTDNAVIPKYAKEGDAGFDLVAIEDVIIEPGETKLIKTGLAFELPPNYEMQIRPRSGVTLKTKLRVQLGTCDSGYRGEVGVIVDNIAEKGKLTAYLKTIDRVLSEPNYYNPENTYIIRKGDRIAQAVIKPVEQAEIIEVDELNETERGTGGFGSTGLSKEALNAIFDLRKSL